MMKRYFCSTILLFALIGQSFAQAKPFPDGVYFTFADLQRHTPAEQMPGKVYSLPESDHEYKIIPESKDVKKSYLRKLVMAYCVGGEMYLNAQHVKVQSSYVQVLTKGRYWVFKGGASNGEANTAALFGGMIGYAIVSSNRHLYILDIETTDRKILKHEKFVEMLHAYPELWEEYSQELKEVSKSEAIYIKYIQKINDLIKY